MKITPLEIKQKSFEKAFRGYEKEEVYAFLSSLSKEWERMQSDQKELKTKLEQTQEEVTKLRNVEDSLFKALKTAEDARGKVIEQANKTAELHMRETQMKSETLMNEAKNKAKSIVENAEARAFDIIQETQNEIKDLQQSYTDLQNKRESLIHSLHMVSDDLIRRLEALAKAPKEDFKMPSLRTKNLKNDTFQRADQEIENLDKIKASDLESSTSYKAAASAQPVKPAPQKEAAYVVNPASATSFSADAKEKRKSFFDELEE